MKQYDQLKKNLREYSVDVDKEKLWQQTAHAIPQKKKRRTVIIPFIFGSLLLSGGLAYYNGHSPLINAFTKIDAGTNTDLQNNHLYGSTFNVLSVSTKLNENNATTASSENPGQVETSSKRNMNMQQLHALNTAHNTVPAIPSSPQGNKLTAKKEFNQKPLLSTNDNSEVQEDILLYSGTEAEIPTSFTKPQRNTKFLPPLSLSQINIDLKPELSDASQTIKPAHHHDRHIFSLYALQSAGFTNLKLDAGNQEAEDMRNFLAPFINSLESVSTTIRGNMRFAKGFSVSAGIAYRRLTTETKYNHTINERTEQEGTTTIIIDELGQQHFVSGNLGSNHIVETEYNRFSTHQNIDLELTLAKTIFGFHRTTVNGYLKAGVNVLYSVNGSAFTAEQELVQFSDTDKPFTLRSPFTYGGGLDIQHRLSPRWILVGTVGMDQLNYQHEDYKQLQWKHTIYALSLGVGYVL